MHNKHTFLSLLFCFSILLVKKVCVNVLKVIIEINFPVTVINDLCIPVNVMQLSEIHCITLFILQGENCGLHKFFVSFNLILSVAVSVIAILPKIQDGKIPLPCECFLWYELYFSTAYFC